MNYFKKSRQVFVISLFALGLLTLISCENKPKKEYYDFYVINTTDQQLTDVRIQWGAKGLHQIIVGAGATKIRMDVYVDITENATAEWVTPDGKKHFKDIGVIQNPLTSEFGDMLIKFDGEDVKVSMRKD